MTRAGIGRGIWTASALTLVAAVSLSARPGPRQERQAASNGSVTFTKDVAPILQDKCQYCHQPGSIAPMSLLSYEAAVRYARRIRTNVSQRIMPPWHIDREVGIREFKNDRGLTDAQIDTIVRWVDQGTPRGEAADLPPPRPAVDPHAWQLADEFGQPDLVLRSPAYTLAPRTQDKWFRPVIETGLTEPRWVRAIEIRPVGADGRRVTHHVLTVLEQHEEGGITGLAESAHEAQMSAGLFMEWAVGKVGEIFPADSGKLMLPGSKIRWEIHMFAIGREIRNEVELGIYFYPKGETPSHRTVLRMFNAAPGSALDIPPGEQAMTQNFYVMPAPARLENFQPHMHMRGKAFSMEAVYPNGRRELLSVVNNFQWKWHVNYVYADHTAPLLPKGTVLVFTAWHDNTAANPNNPDPRQWVGWGDRTVDEMAHAWVDVTYLNQDEFDRLVAARKDRARDDPDRER